MSMMKRCPSLSRMYRKVTAMTGQELIEALDYADAIDDALFTCALAEVELRLVHGKRQGVRPSKRNSGQLQTKKNGVVKP